LAGILGLSNLANLGSKVAGTATRLASDAATQVRYEGVREGSSLWKWLVPALGLLALASLYSLWGGSPQVNKESLVPRALSGLTLPGGMTLSLREGSFNYNLAKFLADTTDTSVSKAFIFDNVNFDSATTRLTAESERTVNDLINILKAYPTTEVRLEGHTDSTGDSEENKKLSQARAEAVKESLVRGGIDASRITTAGFGQEKPIASNDTEDGRAKNRRLELVVAKK
jgi:outer membrane protein OmpA-like peptidoglycan-associated protein